MQERSVRKKRNNRTQNRSIFSRIPKLFNEGALDYYLIVIVLFLVAFGLVMLYSTSSYQAMLKTGDGLYFFKKQTKYALFGIFVMFVASKIEYHIYQLAAPYVYLISAALVCGLFILGKSENGATRWYKFGSFSFQPAEMCKVAVILLLPAMIVRMKYKVDSIKGGFFILCVGAILSILILFISKNLSSAVIVGGITFVILFVVCRKTYPFALMLGAAGVFLVAVVNLAKNMGTSSDFRLRRVIVWLNPENFTDSFAYQTLQSLYAIGSAGLFGKGLGNGIQKMIIPEAMNDMIFAVICEELGLFGVGMMVILFIFLLYRLQIIIKNSPDLFGSLMVTGVFAHIAIQLVFNMAVSLNVIPNTGISLPFISYGGTSLVFLLGEIGMVLSVSRQSSTIETKMEE